MKISLIIAYTRQVYCHLILYELSELVHYQKLGPRGKENNAIIKTLEWMMQQKRIELNESLQNINKTGD